MPGITLSAKASRLAQRGRIWFFRDDLAEADVDHGDLVSVHGPGSRSHGLGLYSQSSRLALRLCGSWSGTAPPTPEEFFAARITSAIERRPGAREPRVGRRLVHGDADGLPGLIIDKYADCLCLQVSAAAVEAHLDCIVPSLVAALTPRMVLARNDLTIRKQEALPLEIRLLHGRRCEHVEIEENGIFHPIDLYRGHKTGFYLDQRPARLLLSSLAAGRRVLDLFSYQGGFGLSALAGGALSALCVDQSAEALQRAQGAADRNRLSGLRLQRANAFDFLRDLRKSKEQYDLVIVDPPAFATSRAQVEGGVRGYRDLNRQAMRVLSPGGMLLTCSCSHHISSSMFEDTLRQAARDLPFRMIIRQRLGAGRDHPISLNLPESEYLKVILLQRLDLP